MNQLPVVKLQEIAKELAESGQRVKVLWQELPYSARLVASADASTEKQAGLDAVLALAEAIAEAGGSGDRSVEAFLGAIEAGGEGPGIVALHDRGEGAVQILTAHGAAGREFDTVIVAGAAEGDFPSLTRPEPMFDLSVLDGWWIEGCAENVTGWAIDDAEDEDSEAAGLYDKLENSIAPLYARPSAWARMQQHCIGQGSLDGLVGESVTLHLFAGRTPVGIEIEHDGAACCSGRGYPLGKVIY